MKTILVEFEKKKRHYPVYIGVGLLKNLKNFLDLSPFSQIAVLSDSLVAPLWLLTLKTGLGKKFIPIIINPGEKEKNINTAKTIWDKLFRAGFDRKSLLINLGGGVIGDIGGFVAGIYMRGIPFLQIPTTLLAQADAAIGGKVRINYKGIKNGLGLFNQPFGVVIEINTLSTLPKREFLSGFAEIIKHGIIQGGNYFKLVTSKKPLDFSVNELIEIIEGSGLIKARIAQKDEKESGLREILNFGHTIGHALGSLGLKTSHPLLHGEAVAIGMIAESRLANLVGLLPTSELLKIKKTIKNSGLPAKGKIVSTEGLLREIEKDKKIQRGKIRWSLPRNIGEVSPGVEVSKRYIIQAIKYIGV